MKRHLIFILISLSAIILIFVSVNKKKSAKQKIVRQNEARITSKQNTSLESKWQSKYPEMIRGSRVVEEGQEFELNGAKIKITSSYITKDISKWDNIKANGLSKADNEVLVINTEIYRFKQTEFPLCINTFNLEVFDNNWEGCKYSGSSFFNGKSQKELRSPNLFLEEFPLYQKINTDIVFESFSNINTNSDIFAYATGPIAGLRMIDPKLVVFVHLKPQMNN